MDSGTFDKRAQFLLGRGKCRKEIFGWLSVSVFVCRIKDYDEKKVFS